jgi:hypothetical protein
MLYPAELLVQLTYFTSKIKNPAKPGVKRAKLAFQVPQYGLQYLSAAQMNGVAVFVE